MEAFCYAVEQCMSYVRELHVTDEVLDADEQRKLIPTVRRFSQVGDYTLLRLLIPLPLIVHSYHSCVPTARSYTRLLCICRKPRRSRRLCSTLRFRRSCRRLCSTIVRHKPCC